jgi:uncharacterized membrane protein AbrB (regulator of aidB expression)
MDECLQRVVLILFWFAVCLLTLRVDDMILNVAAPWMFCSMVMVVCIVKKKGNFSEEQESSDRSCGVC